MLYNIITPSKTPYFAGKYVILPNPNRITLIALSGIWKGDFIKSFPTFSPQENFRFTQSLLLVLI